MGRIQARWVINARSVTCPGARPRRSLAYRAPMNRRRVAALVGCHGRRPAALRVLARRRHPGLGGRARRSSVTPQSPPPGAEPLARFYSQRSTGPTARAPGAPPSRCRSTTTNPQGDTIELAARQGAGAGGRRSASGRSSSTPEGPVASGVDYARAADFIVGKGGAQRLRRRRVRPARGAALRPDRLRHRHRARRLPRLGPDARRRRGGAGLRRRRPAASRRRCGSERRRRSSRTCRPRTPPATWTSCGPRSGRRSSPTSASPTAPTSAPSTPDLFPDERGPDGARRRRRPRPHPRGGQPRPGQGLRARDPGSGPPTASSRATARSATRSTQVMKGLRTFLALGRPEPAAPDG